MIRIKNLAYLRSLHGGTSTAFVEEWGGCCGLGLVEGWSVFAETRMSNAIILGSLKELWQLSFLGGM